MVWLLFSASGFMGGTLAARVNVLILMGFFFKGILKERDPINLWIWDTSRIKCGMSQVEWKA